MLSNLVLGGAGVSGLIHPAVAGQIEAQKKQVLIFLLNGGLSQFESFDPKPGTDTGGPFRSIPTSVPGTHFCELMPHTATIAHKLAVVAAGQADATWTLRPKNEWDVAGGVALLKAAGGLGVFPDGTEPAFNQPDPMVGALLSGGVRRIAAIQDLVSQ